MKNKFKILIVFVGCLLFRLLPLRAPNVEPIMASIMPLGRKYGPFTGFLFGFGSMALYDLVTGKIGPWTLSTGLAYGLIGAVSFFYFKKYQAKTFNFITFTFFATIFFDLMTGVLFAPMFHQTILNALILQVPFTALHLAGNIGFALTLSPLLSRWLMSEKVFSFSKKYRGLTYVK